MDLLKMYLIEKLSFYKRQISALCLIVLGLVTLAIQSESSGDESSYLVAEEKYSKWLKDPKDEQSFLEMKKALKKVPDLERKYGAMIAQELFQRNQLADAIVFAEDALKHIQLEAPFHAMYGQTSVLIEQGSFQDALELAVNLKESMDSFGFESIENSKEAGSLLYAHNLLRIACLQKELSNKPGEKAAWDALEIFFDQRQSLAKQVMGTFRDGGLDLSHYISERKKSL